MENEDLKDTINSTTNIISFTENLWMTPEISLLTKSFVAFQVELKPVAYNKQNAGLRNEYSTLDEIQKTVNPLLAKHGLCITQDIAGDWLVTMLVHSSGQFKASKVEIKSLKTNGAVNQLQALGGGITYLKRYTYSAIVGISTEKDDDGNKQKAAKKTDPNIEEFILKGITKKIEEAKISGEVTSIYNKSIEYFDKYPDLKHLAKTKQEELKKLENEKNQTNA